MAVFKRTYPSGKVAWVCDFYDAHNRRRRKSFRTRQKAQDAEARFRQERFEQKVFGIIKKKTVYFENVVEKFLEVSKSSSKRRTYEAHQVRINQLEKFFNGKVLSEVTLLDVEEYKNRRLRTVSISTVNRELSVLKRIFNLAEQWELTSRDRNIAGKIRIERKKEPQDRIRFLSKKEVEKLLEVCRVNRQLYTAVMLALHTGARRGEVVGMEWEQLDFEKMDLTIDRQLTGYKKEDSTKSNRPRKVPLNSKLLEVLKGWRDSGEAGEKRVFRDKWFRPSYENALEKAGLSDCNFHSLRHTFASQLVRQGVDVATVSELLGHSTLQMTMRYIHTTGDQKRGAVECLGHLLGT